MTKKSGGKGEELRGEEASSPLKENVKAKGTPRSPEKGILLPREFGTRKTDY